MPKKMPIFYSALLLTGVNLLLRLAGTSFQVYISGRIGAAGVGLLQLVMSVGALAFTAAMAGGRTTAMYLTAEELGKKQEGNVVWVLSACFLYSIVCSGIVAFGLYTLAPGLAQGWIGDIRAVGALRLYAGFLPVTCLCGVMSGYFTAANRIAVLAAVEVAEQLFSMGATLLLLHLWAGSDAARACEAVVLGSGLGGMLSLCLLVLLRLMQRPAPGKQIPVGRRLLHCALPLALADVVKSGLSTTENVMVPKRLALHHTVLDPLAAFGTVCGMVFPVLMFPAAILFGLAELLIPELARCNAAGSQQRIRYLVKRSLYVTLLYGCVFSMVGFFLGKDISLRLFGNEEAGHYLPLYSLLIPMLYCDAITDALTKGLGQQKACVRYNVVTSFLDVVFLFLLLPRWGMDGYFFSFALTHGINFCLSLRRLLQISGLRLPMGKLLWVAAGMCASLVMGALLPKPTLSCMAGITVMGCLMYLSGLLRKEELLWLGGLIRKK